MSKRTTFTTISPLPVNITRQVVIDFLHDHEQMIDLNPLVKERHPIKPPPHASPDELHCIWYSLTDKISYLPGGLADGDVTYSSAFHDLPDGLQTHCYAPAGLSMYPPHVIILITHVCIDAATRYTLKMDPQWLPTRRARRARRARDWRSSQRPLHPRGR